MEPIASGRVNVSRPRLERLPHLGWDELLAGFYPFARVQDLLFPRSFFLLQPRLQFLRLDNGASQPTQLGMDVQEKMYTIRNIQIAQS
jgi:hypothetical protein